MGALGIKLHPQVEALKAHDSKTASCTWNDSELGQQGQASPYCTSSTGLHLQRMGLSPVPESTTLSHTCTTRHAHDFHSSPDRLTTTKASPLTPLLVQLARAACVRWLPALALVRTYQRSWLVKDLVAGLALTAILVPVGMGYAEAAGLPAIYGLYATIVPLVAYALFGPSRILVLGPDSALAGIIAATILPLAADNPDRLVSLAGLLAMLTGALCILAGLARFGFVTDLLSKPIRYGYLNGIALTVLVGQLPKIFGFSVSGDNLIQEANNLVYGILNGQTNGTALVIGLACLLVIVGFRRWAPNIPGILIAVSGATIVVGVFNLATQAGLAVVGPLPQGLPAFQFPSVSLDEFGTLFASAVAIALVAFADMSVLSRTFALRGGYEVDRNQELIALGAANVAAGLFQGFSISSSASRTPVAESAGEVAAHGTGWRGLYRAVVDLCTAAVAELAHRRPGRGRDLRLFLAGRDSRRGATVSLAAQASSCYRSCAFWAWR